ncbi:hypothetical protein QVD17_22397 [Tagetes erecta]|uniref:F-box associated beta-propeller type 3 domain-containing protein n=1 Tax=Tagetes erecta TaxID=13708 RepID=A0AAD8KJC2_TARER|nr:hypothetical protein QVD17_22397 [Tagetes erecta]
MASELSCEMMMEIISRASLKTLDVMRCTSKELNALAYESCLVDLYKKRNKIVSGFVIQNMRKGWMHIKEFAPSPESTHLDLGFLPDNARILATSDQGIMVFRNPYRTDLWKDLFYVCKPATKQVLALPNPEGDYTVHQKYAIMVMGLKPLHYKIIRFSDHSAATYRCDIFDSMTREWRSLKHVTLPYGVFLTNPPPISKSGSIYMLLTNNDILKFDAYSEKWKVFPSPVPYDESSRPYVELVKYGGRLGMVCKPQNPNGCWEIWVVTKGQLWEKIYVCKEKKGSLESLKALYDPDTSVMVDCNTLMYCRFKQEGDNMIDKKLNGRMVYEVEIDRSY